MQVGHSYENQKVRIMCLGDSITSGSHSSTSYRYYLYKSLLSDGYTDFIFVGSMTGVSDSSGAIPTDWDSTHEGHPGWTAEQIVTGSGARSGWAAGKLSGPGGWAKVYRPDIALVDLGLNDLSRRKSPKDAVESVGKVIDSLRAANSRIDIALAAVTPEWSQEPGYNEIPDFNNLIRTLALQKTTLTSPIFLVDLNTGIDPNTDLVDGVHPGDPAHKKISDRWLPIVEEMINRVKADRRKRNTTFTTQPSDKKQRKLSDDAKGVASFNE
jgi:lysophospholipase L1-like esterase